MRRLVFLLLLTIPVYTTDAATVDSSIKTAWGYSSFDKDNGGVEDFVLAGGTGKVMQGPIDCTLSQADQSRTYGMIGVVAHRIVAHGALFCTSQVVCDSNSNRYPKSKVWFSWYSPSNATCQWLCDEGYAGNECAAASGLECDKDTKFTTVFKDNVQRAKNHDDFTKRKKCDSVSKIDESIMFFEEMQQPSKGVVLGVIKFLEHGVIAAPVKLECADRDDRKAWLNGISLADGKRRVLCAAGYRPVNNNCVAISDDVCNGSGAEACSGFPVDKYDAKIHTRFLDNGCWKYTCSDKKKAFASATDKSCTVDCGTDIKSGVDTTTGLCKKCETGEYFNNFINGCDKAAQYTQQNLKYGKKDRTKSENITEQCWTMGGDEYKSCVTK